MIETSLLNCGARLVTEPMDDVRSVSIGCWVGTGSRDESAGQSGISHFLEHLLFKGTPERSARDIAESIDAVGGDMNAYTTKEYTTFYVRTLARDSDCGLDVLADILQNPALRQGDVDAERQVILEEVLMHLDEPSDVVQERFAGAMFPGHTLGREVLGDPEVVTAVSVAEIRAFFDRHYLPGNVVFSAAGALSHGELREGIERRFSSWSGGAPPDRQAPSQGVRQLDVLSRDTEQAHLVVGVRSPDRHSPLRWAMAVMNFALGGGVSSRLFQRIREERGLAYSVVSERSAYHDAGCLTVSVGSSPEHAQEVLSLVISELDDVAAKGITERELEVAVGHLRADTLLSLEDSGSRMSRIGGSLLLHGEVLTIDEVIARIEAVTLEEIREHAAPMLAEERVLAVVGPFDEGDFSAHS